MRGACSLRALVLRHARHGAQVGVDDLRVPQPLLRVALQTSPLDQMRSVQREANGEGRTDPNRGVDLDAPTVAEDCVTCDRKSKTSSCTTH